VSFFSVTFAQFFLPIVIQFLRAHCISKRYISKCFSEPRWRLAAAAHQEFNFSKPTFVARASRARRRVGHDLLWERTSIQFMKPDSTLIHYSTAGLEPIQKPTQILYTDSDTQIRIQSPSFLHFNFPSMILHFLFFISPRALTEI
jgi:hypothetical protein